MKIVIIGSGKTGRGFIAPILHRNGHNITFVDKNKNLIDALKHNNSYRVHYFDESEAYKVDNYQALHIDENDTIKVISEADIVTTSVFANQIHSLKDILESAISIRTKKNPLIIICIENGVNVKEPLLGLKADISEGIIFCTSLEYNDTLDLISEANIELPIDNKSLSNNLEIQGMPQIDDFSEMIQRKIYTYNYLSAVIAYMGYAKNEKTYADAANSEVISKYIDELLPELNALIAKEFDKTIEIQTEFSQMALNKFRNHKIYDSIERNAQQVARKLGPNERVLKPIKLAIKYQAPYDIFLPLIAYAIHYGVQEENLDAKKILLELETELNVRDLVSTITSYLETM